jgi:predicted transcriptional regulator
MTTTPSNPENEPSKEKSISQLFHRLNRVIPENQELMKVAPGDKVSDALQKMRKHKFSQLPVVDGSRVLGVFSHRSFSERIIRLNVEIPKLGDLLVDDCYEKIHFAKVTDEFSMLFEQLDRDNAVLIGEPDRLQGIVTPMDVLRYLYGIASPFVLLTEIEVALRALIESAVDEPQLRECITKSLGSKYTKKGASIRLSDMVFSDYIELICDEQNWSLFQSALGGTREVVRVKLDEVRQIRNIVFHFKRDLTWDDEYPRLADYREWLLSKAGAIDARKGNTTHE